MAEKEVQSLVCAWIEYVHRIGWPSEGNEPALNKID